LDQGEEPEASGDGAGDGYVRMITTPTVFVLGAGASVDFDFPVGKALVNQVVANLRGSTTLRDHVLATGFSLTDAQDFTNALRFSAEVSIDAFFEKRPTFMNIGKAAMAAELINCEDTENGLKIGESNLMQRKPRS
jgi:hypothetical protein